MNNIPATPNKKYTIIILLSIGSSSVRFTYYYTKTSATTVDEVKDYTPNTIL